MAELSTVRRRLLRLLLYRYIQLIMRAIEAKILEEYAALEEEKRMTPWWRSVPMAMAVFVLIVTVMFIIALIGYLTGAWQVPS